MNFGHFYFVLSLPTALKALVPVRDGESRVCAIPNTFPTKLILYLKVGR